MNQKLGYYIVIISVMLFGNIQAQEIAITFDDAPLGNGQYYTGLQRTETLIKKLKKLGIPQVAFFCNPSKMNEEGTKRIKSYN